VMFGHSFTPLPRHRYGEGDCRACATSLFVRRADRPGPAAGIRKHRGTHLSKKYKVTLAHELEKRVHMDYTFVWRKQGYLFFLGLLAIAAHSVQRRTAFDFVKRRHMD
jgi:hypothetical protein